MNFQTEMVLIKSKRKENFNTVLNNPIKTRKIIIFWLLTVFIPIFVVIFFIGLTGQSFDESTFDNPLIYFTAVILGEISIILMGMVFLGLEKQSFIRSTGLTWEKKRSLKYLIIGLLVGSLIILFRDILSVIFHIQEISNLDVINIYYFLFTLLNAGLIGLLSAIAEETAYRGIIQNNFSDKLPKYLAICLTSVLFVFPHALGSLTGLELLTIFINSLILGLVFMFTNRLYISIGLHFGNNFTIIFLDSCLSYINVNVSVLVLIQISLSMIILIFLLVKRKNFQIQTTT